MRLMLRLIGRAPLKSGQDIGNISRHGDVYLLVAVVSIERQTKVVGTVSLGLALVVLLDCIK